MALRLTILGTSGSYPGPGAACSGYLIRSDDTTVWLDAGSGTLANLQAHVGLDDVDAIVLSHEHPDHWHDLEGFLVAIRYGDHDRRGVPVYAPAGLREHCYFDPEPELDWRVVRDGDTAAIGELRFAFSRTDHGPETLACRIEHDGRAVVYSADTGPGWSLDRLGVGADLALCEATLLPDQEGTVQHLSGRQAAAQAKQAGAARLVLTHFWPTVDSAAAVADATRVFDGPVEAAVVGAEYTL